MNMNPQENSAAKGASTVDKVTEYIKQKILYHELKSGEKIPTESDLCKLLNVSRSSVREAIKILEAMNIVCIKRGDGTYISGANDIFFPDSLLFKMILSNVSVADLTEFRKEIEYTALKLAIAHAAPEDIEALKENVRETELCVQRAPDDYQAIHELDVRFHQLLGECTKNTLFKELYNFTFRIFSLTIYNNYKGGQKGEPTIQTHKHAIAAIENKDYTMAGYAVTTTLLVWTESYSKKGDETAITTLERP